MKQFAIVLVVVAVLIALWYLASPLFITTQVIEEVPEDVIASRTLLKEGVFADADQFHRGSGTARIYRLPDDTTTLHLNDFTVTNGPDLHVLLATQSAPSESDELGQYIDLGELKGNQGSQYYEIPSDTDLSAYKSVVIYCKPFHVVFSVATFQ